MAYEMNIFRGDGIRSRMEVSLDPHRRRRDPHAGRRFVLAGALVTTLLSTGCVSAAYHERALARAEARNARLSTELRGESDRASALAVEVAGKERVVESLERQLASASREAGHGIAATFRNESLLASLSEREARIERLSAENRTISTRLDEALSDLAHSTGVSYVAGSGRLTVAGQVLFASGEAALTPSGQRVLDEVAAALRGAQASSIRIEGHTDSDPIARTSSRWPLGNWELSGARALGVLAHLEGRGVAPTTMTFVGCGPHFPVESNDTPEGKAANRRVEIHVEDVEGLGHVQ